MKEKYRHFERQIILEKYEEQKKEKWMQKFQSEVRDEHFAPESSSDSSHKSYTHSNSDDVLDEEEEPSDLFP